MATACSASSWERKGLTWLSPGVYVLCFAARGQPREAEAHVLLRLDAAGDVFHLADAQGGEWAPKLWPPVEAALAAAPAEPEEDALAAGSLSRAFSQAGFVPAGSEAQR